MSRPERYPLAAISLHWLVAGLILFALGLGLRLFALPLSPHKLQLLAWHKWLGLLVLAAAGLRLLLRLAYRAPALPASIPARQQRFAHYGHAALYLLMLATPLSGWLMSSAYGIPVVLLQHWRLPALIAADPALAEALKWLHRLLVSSLLLAASGHAAAAYRHHFIAGNGLLWRMCLRRPAKGG